MNVENGLTVKIDVHYPILDLLLNTLNHMGHKVRYITQIQTNRKR